MAEHGHGHEKAGGHGGGHSEWTKHLWNGIRALAVGVAVAAFAPPLLAASGVYMPAYMAKAAGIFAGTVNFANQYDSPKSKNESGGGHHH